jgi:hypothetical protein
MEFPAELQRWGEATIPMVKPLPDEVDVVLRPAPENVSDNYSIWEIWGEEIVIKGVKVQR